MPNAHGFACIGSCSSGTKACFCSFCILEKAYTLSPLSKAKKDFSDFNVIYYFFVIHSEFLHSLYCIYLELIG
jgi:hypothetical protein